MEAYIDIYKRIKHILKIFAIIIKTNDKCRKYRAHGNIWNIKKYANVTVAMGIQPNGSINKLLFM